MSAPQVHPERKSEDASNNLTNFAAKGIPYFTPAQDPAAGSLKEASSSTPKLFSPLTVRGLTFQNRIWLSPMCQYSAQNGHLTPWHMAHLGGIISRGPGLSIIEATAVLPEGRITPEDSGIWLDSHVDAPNGLKDIVNFAHSQNQKIGIQLAHAGRKASTVAPWISSNAMATESLNGWPTNLKAPSAIPQGAENATPKAMTLADIDELKTAWAAGVKRALRAGFDTIEIHNAHGYLLHEFLSPVSNTRTDSYGGSFENRVRLTLEVVKITRDLIPKDMPLLLRLSSTDWLETNPDFKGESWTVKDSIKLAHLLSDAGVDVLDISSGIGHAEQKIISGPGYQAPAAKAVKKSLLEAGSKMLVTAVGSITGGKQAEAILSGKGEEEQSRGETELDAIFVGRPFQKEPGLVWKWADELDVKIRVANQIGWGVGQKRDLSRK